MENRGDRALSSGSAIRTDRIRRADSPARPPQTAHVLMARTGREAAGRRGLGPANGQRALVSRRMGRRAAGDHRVTRTTCVRRDGVVRQDAYGRREALLPGGRAMDARSLGPTAGPPATSHLARNWADAMGTVPGVVWTRSRRSLAAEGRASLKTMDRRRAAMRRPATASPRRAIPPKVKRERIAGAGAKQSLASPTLERQPDGARRSSARWMRPRLRIDRGAGGRLGECATIRVRAGSLRPCSVPSKEWRWSRSRTETRPGSCGVG